jgi:hypothetical protein
MPVDEKVRSKISQVDGPGWMRTQFHGRGTMILGTTVDEGGRLARSD